MSPISPSAGPPQADCLIWFTRQFQRELTSIRSAYVELPVVQRLLGHVGLIKFRFVCGPRSSRPNYWYSETPCLVLPCRCRDRFNRGDLFHLPSS
jgi:hypothetical protein